MALFASHLINVYSGDKIPSLQKIINHQYERLQARAIDDRMAENQSLPPRALLNASTIRKYSPNLSNQVLTILNVLFPEMGQLLFASEIISAVTDNHIPSLKEMMSHFCKKLIGREDQNDIFLDCQAELESPHAQQKLSVHINLQEHNLFEQMFFSSLEKRKQEGDVEAQHAFDKRFGLIPYKG